MSPLSRTICFLALFLTANISAFAYPNFLEDYKADKFTNAKNKDAICNFCHMSPGGGDERNEFGKAFEAGGEKFTPMLRAQFPDRFSYPMLKVSDTLIIHFSDPDNKVVVVQSGTTRAEVNLENKTVDGKPATPGGDIAGAAPGQPSGGGGAAPAAASGFVQRGRSDVPTDPLAREGAFFGQSIVDLPNGKVLAKGGVDFWIGHRFPEKVFDRHSPADLFGFDSAATVAFGVRVGLTNRWDVAVLRSNFFRTIEFASELQVSRQADGMPATLTLRGSVEGRNNFARKNYDFWVGYAPSLQIVAVRTFWDRVSFAAVPTFAFNTRNENSPLPQLDAEHNNTIAMGVGLGIRFLPTVSAVGEWVPRLWGYGGERTVRPQIGFGVQKATFRHTFSLIFSTVRPLTVSRYAQGTGGGAFTGLQDTFGIGFNIYRRLR